jgi:uncharacterized protein (DUF302 family)
MPDGSLTEMNTSCRQTYLPLRWCEAQSAIGGGHRGQAGGDPDREGDQAVRTIDHSTEAQTAGLELRETKVVIFGSPVAGTPVMQAAPLAALDLPLKVLVWADGDQTKLSYSPPAVLGERYGLSDDLTARLAAIDAVTDAAISG